jgi:hypothetical protein
MQINKVYNSYSKQIAENIAMIDTLKIEKMNLRINETVYQKHSKTDKIIVLFLSLSINFWSLRV